MGMARSWFLHVAWLASTCGLPMLCGAAEPERAAQPTIHGTLGTKGRCYALTFSPDGKQLLAGGDQIARGKDTNHQIEVWDVETRSLLRQLDSGHCGQIRAITYSQSGRYWAVGHIDGFISVRDVRGDVVLSFRSIEGYLNNHLEHVSISETDKGGFVHSVICGNIAQTRSIPGGEKRIYDIPCDGGYAIDSAAMSRNGTTLICCTPKFLNVYEKGDFSSGRALQSFSTFNNPTIVRAAISDDATTALVTEYRGELALFDLKKDRLIRKWLGHDDPPIYTSLPFHGRNWFATGNDTGEIKIWDEKGELRALLKVPGNDHPIAALALTRDNRFLASSGEERPIVVWDLQALLGDEKSGR
jgi:WD40 repeat protein